MDGPLKKKEPTPLDLWYSATAGPTYTSLGIASTCYEAICSFLNFMFEVWDLLDQWFPNFFLQCTPNNIYVPCAYPSVKD